MNVDTSDPATFSPAAIDLEIRACIKRMEKGVKYTSDAEAVASKARRDYDVAVAKATLRVADVGLPNAEARKAWVVLETQVEREKADVLEEAYKYAQRQARALEHELSGLRSLLVTSRQLYGEVGRGES